LAKLCLDFLAPLYLYCFIVHSILITLIMEAIQTSTTLVNLYQSTWRYNTEDNHLHMLSSVPTCPS
jgi:hypothetical protein